MRTPIKTKLNKLTDKRTLSNRNCMYIKVRKKFLCMDRKYIQTLFSKLLKCLRILIDYQDDYYIARCLFFIGISV